MTQVPGHTLQFGERMPSCPRDGGLREVTLECGCGVVLATVFMVAGDHFADAQCRLMDAARRGAYAAHLEACGIFTDEPKGQGCPANAS